MEQDLVVTVESRTPAGSNASRRLRRAGMVPGVVYGMNVDPFTLTVDPRSVDMILKLESGSNTIFKLKLGEEDAKQRAVMIREIQRDPVTYSMVHVDFVRVDLDKVVQVHVPLALDGEPAGVKLDGGTLDVLHRTVHVECLPSAIPESLHLDVSALKIGDHVSISDLAAVAEVTILDSEDVVLAVVHAPREEEKIEEEEVEGEGVEAADAESGDSEGSEESKES
jgi:large subunit ribosomal protein L25